MGVIMQGNYNFSEYRQMTKDELQTALVGTLVLLGGVGMKLYDFWRRTKTDKQADSLAESTHMHSAALIDYYKREAQEHAALSEQRLVTIERVSNERNEAVQQLGALQAKVEHLSELVIKLSNDLKEEQAENRELKAMVQSMAVTNKQILQMLEEKGNDV